MKKEKSILIDSKDFEKIFLNKKEKTEKKQKEKSKTELKKEKKLIQKKQNDLINKIDYLQGLLINEKSKEKQKELKSKINEIKISPYYKFNIKLYNENQNENNSILYFENLNYKYNDIKKNKIDFGKYKNFINEYLKLLYIEKKYQNENSIIQYEIQKIINDKILILVNELGKKYNKLYIENDIKKKIKNSKVNIFSQLENENIFGNNKNFNINFINKINNQFILEKIKTSENQKIKAKINGLLKKQNNIDLQYFEKIINDYINNNKSKCNYIYINDLINKKDTIKSDYIWTINNINDLIENNQNIKNYYYKVNRIYNKYYNKFTNKQKAKKMILNYYKKDINTELKKYKNLKNEILNDYKNENTKINILINRKTKYFKNEYNNLYNEYIKTY